jgi:hypothetical protein
MFSFLTLCISFYYESLLDYSEADLIASSEAFTKEVLGIKNWLRTSAL